MAYRPLQLRNPIAATQNPLRYRDTHHSRDALNEKTDHAGFSSTALKTMRPAIRPARKPRLSRVDPLR